MAVTKLQISSPLEAGTSLLDSKQLPPRLNDALEFISKRLARKELSITLIVVRRDMQVPSAAPSPRTPVSPTSLVASPVQSLFGSSARYSSSSSLSSSSSTSSTASYSRTRWPSLPSSPKEFKDSESPPSPSRWSSQSPTPSTPTSVNSFNISLIHACTLTPRAERHLRSAVAQASKKFSLGSGWLSARPLATPIACPQTNDLIRRSLAQNSILFSSPSLTLLELDHVYTFKCLLHTYSLTLAPSDFALAVDELRRVILAQNRVTKGYLLRAYDWVGISLAALADVNQGYKSTYGGSQRRGGIEESATSISPPPIKTSFFTGSEFRSASPRRYELVKMGESAKGCEVVEKKRAMSPNGFESLTPVTRGESLCLMVGESWKGRSAPVASC